MLSQIPECLYKHPRKSLTSRNGKCTVTNFIVQHLRYLMPLSPPPGIYFSRLSVKSAEAVFYLLAQDIWVHGVRQRLLCKRLHWVPVLSQVKFRLSFDMLCQLVHQLLFMARWAENSREHCLIGLLQGWALEREEKNLFFLQKCWRPTCNRGLTFGGVTVQTVHSILSMHVQSYSSCDQG